MAEKWASDQAMRLVTPAVLEEEQASTEATS